MKRNSKIALLTSVFLLLCLLASCAKKPTEIQGIRSLRFAYTCGTQMTDQVSYTLTKKLSGYSATVKPQGIDPSAPLVVQVDEEFVRQVEEILRSNHVEKWDGYKQRSNSGTEGVGFAFSLKMKGGKEIEAMGYMGWPNGYDEVKAGMDSVFLGLWEASGQALPTEATDD